MGELIGCMIMILPMIITGLIYTIKKGEQYD